jgi:hypothetical protein
LQRLRGAASTSSPSRHPERIFDSSAIEGRTERGAPQCEPFNHASAASSVP